MTDESTPAPEKPKRIRKRSPREKTGRPNGRPREPSGFVRAARAEALAMVLAGKTRQEVADHFKRPRRTIDDWMVQPDVKAELDRRTAAIHEDARRVLSSAVVAAARTTKKVIGFGAQVMVDAEGNPRHPARLTQGEQVALGRALDASGSVMDRMGMGRATKVDVQMTAATGILKLLREHLTRQEYERVFNVLVEKGGADGAAIDVPGDAG